MANYKVTDTELTSIANAIRTKGGTQAQLEFPQGFIDAINAISGGGGGGGGVNIVSWASGSDADVAAMIDAAQAGTIDLQQDGGWAVGDVRTIHIDAFTGGNNMAHAAQDIDIVITSFDEYMSCGNVMQFDFKDSLSESQNMNSQNTNVGGYGSMEMKTTTLPALVSALPSWLRTRLIEFSVLASEGSQSSTIQTITGNKLSLRSEVEIYGTTQYSFNGEGSQISYYETADNRKKKYGHNGSDGAWWFRSPFKINNFSYCAAAIAGGMDFNNSTSGVGIAPFGCL